MGVLALTCHIELFVLAHYRGSVDSDSNASELWKDVFLYHWREESQHAILDELEWQREDAKLSPDERDRAVDDLIELVGAIEKRERIDFRKGVRQELFREVGVALIPVQKPG